MGVRQALNENPIISMAGTGIIIVAALMFIFWHLGGGHRRHSAVAEKMYYSDDDGKTYFADQAYKMTPFLGPNSRPAVQAMVFQCGNGKPFVVYLSRNSEEGRHTAEKVASDPGLPVAFRPNPTLIEVKRPGTKTWMKFDPKNPKTYVDATMPKCPGGGTGFPRPIYPPP
jgi:hypothetical protein